MSDGGLEIARPSGNDAIVCIDAAIAKNAVDDKMYANIRKRFIFLAKAASINKGSNLHRSCDMLSEHELPCADYRKTAAVVADS